MDTIALIDDTNETLAAKYAVEACEEAGYGFGDDEIKTHLVYCRINRVVLKFVDEIAYNEAISIIKAGE